MCIYIYIFVTNEQMYNYNTLIKILFGHLYKYSFEVKKGTRIEVFGAMGRWTIFSTIFWKSRAF